MSTSCLRHLANIISTGVEAIETTYAIRGVAYPALDEPNCPDGLQDPALTKSTATVIAAAGQLIATIQNPSIYLIDASMAAHCTAMIGAANELNLAEILREAGQNGLHINDIGLRAKSSPEKIARVLRYLATHHIFREVSPDVFATNKISSLLDTGKPVDAILENSTDKHINTSGISALVGHFTDEVFRGSSQVPTWIKDPCMVFSQEPADAPAMKAVNSAKDLWGWLEEAGNEYPRKRFNAAMRSTSALIPDDTVVNGFDWSSIPKSSVIVDVGGGIGAATLYVCKAFPHLNFVIQDRPSVVCDAQKFWSTQHPKAIETGQVTLQAHDFFTPQPIKNAAMFLLRWIFHDWSTKYCRIILRHLRDAATPSTRLIVLDIVLPYASNSEREEAIPRHHWPKAPFPLLSNFGLANSFAYSMDIHACAPICNGNTQLE